MPLSPDELDHLLHLVQHTRDTEIDCDECFARVAEFAERELANKPAAARILAVEQHLSICAECREEFQALMRALRET